MVKCSVSNVVVKNTGPKSSNLDLSTDSVSYQLCIPLENYLEFQYLSVLHCRIKIAIGFHEDSENISEIKYLNWNLAYGRLLMSLSP